MNDTDRPKLSVAKPQRRNLRRSPIQKLRQNKDEKLLHLLQSVLLYGLLRFFLQSAVCQLYALCQDKAELRKVNLEHIQLQNKQVLHITVLKLVLSLNSVSLLAGPFYTYTQK